MAGTQTIPRDWSELLALFKSADIEYLVIGAYALAAHGYERYTKDLDLWLAPTSDNARKLDEVLTLFGFPDLAPSVEDWMRENSMIQLGREPYRVDLLNFASGLEYFESSKFSVEGQLAGIPVRCLDRDSLVTNKLATGRLQDFADAEAIAPERRQEIRAALARMLAEKTSTEPDSGH